MILKMNFNFNFKHKPRAAGQSICRLTMGLDSDHTGKFGG
jgi:hypothetical protein